MAASILLVEDDSQIVRAILPALEVSGWTVTIALTGSDALKHLDARDWDALIVDLGLPDMDGKSIIRYSRSSSAVPVVVISAQHSTKEVQRANEAGACCFLHKPFRTSDLIELVKTWIAKPNRPATKQPTADQPQVVEPGAASDE